MTKFLVKKNDVYYLTTGKLLEYDPRAAKGKPKEEEGVAEVEKVFDEIRNSPHTWYEAVQVDIANFAPMNTGQKS